MSQRVPFSTNRNHKNTTTGKKKIQDDDKVSGIAQRKWKRNKQKHMGLGCNEYKNT